MQSSSLPEDVIVVILSRLPVKSLLRFKCVCTRWRSLISSSFFASVHLDRSISNPARHSLLVHELRRRNKHMSLDLPTFSPNENLNLGLDRAYTFGPELIYAGSINGLICMLGNSADSLLIWNPSTRMFKTLPIGRHTDPSCLSIGFGWDSISDDYKVVKIGSNYEDGKLRRTWSEVWSANLDSWSEVEIDQNFGLLKNSCDVIVKGFAYWLAEDGFESDRISLVASFDIRTEVLKLVPVPDSLVGPQNDFDCMNWKETFALIARISSEPRKIYQVWTMENGSVGKEYWSKKFTFELDVDFYCFVNSVNGKFVQRKHRKLILYDMETRETKIVGRVKFPVLGAFYYVESLVSIKGFSHVGEDVRRRWSELELNTGNGLQLE